MIKKYKNNRGLTLIEIIISLALLAIVSMFILSGIQFAMKTLFASGNYMESNYERQAEMENFIRTKSAASGITTGVILDIDWNTTTSVPDFQVTGDQLDKPSSSLHLNETFKVYVPLTITPSQ